jgi:hypothetical protein
MLADEIRTVLALKERMAQRIIGQSHALEAIAQRIRMSRANLTDPRRPTSGFFRKLRGRRKMERSPNGRCGPTMPSGRGVMLRPLGRWALWRYAVFHDPRSRGSPTGET